MFTAGPFLGTCARRGSIWNLVPTSFMGPGLTLLHLAVKSSMAPSTWVQYIAAWRSWCCFFTSSGHGPDLFSEDLILSFLNCLMAHFYSCSHIQKTLSGISFFFKLSDIPSCLSFFSVKQALRGYKRQHVSVDSR